MDEMITKRCTRPARIGLPYFYMMQNLEIRQVEGGQVREH